MTFVYRALAITNLILVSFSVEIVGYRWLAVYYLPFRHQAALEVKYLSFCRTGVLVVHCDAMCYVTLALLMYCWNRETKKAKEKRRNVAAK